MKQVVTILGATGSIGRNTLDVIGRNRDAFEIFALTGGRNVDEMHRLCLAHRPRVAVMADEQAAEHLHRLFAESGCATEVECGVEALKRVSAHPNVDTLMSAIVGAAGLLPTLAAVEAGKKVLLANKEALVMSGQLFVDKVREHGATLLPIDSEHNAIFQCMPEQVQRQSLTMDLKQQGIHKILLTGSGGPFLTRDLTTFDDITVGEAVAHPNWSMGRKISVDSATMMNKGLEFIEAKWLFNANVDDIEVVIHPQSMIHSMVQYKDGSVLAQMGQPDMRTPIAHALAYPARIDAGVAPLDFSAMTDFSFTHPDFKRYPNLALAIEACRAGQGATTCLNAANEVAVAAFLAGRIRFTDIYRINADTLEQTGVPEAKDLTQILQCDELARTMAGQLVEKAAR